MEKPQNRIHSKAILEKRGDESDVTLNMVGSNVNFRLFPAC
uniref:Uncharacterized protein n=1 Tax=Meloidogyne enterolobii TaxID=390850 RepID=A0A6V7X3P6_MELEN|nr:unnamed protein product [Meloidogyne enterolobii]